MLRETAPRVAERPAGWVARERSKVKESVSALIEVPAVF
jgi:hypothetical protein